MKPADKILVGKLEAKRPLLRLGFRLNDNIKVDLMEQDKRVWSGFI
jgi:hypothetical protein